jgi:hypothetical protein
VSSLENKVMVVTDVMKVGETDYQEERLQGGEGACAICSTL